MIKLETSLDRIRDVVTRPGIFEVIAQDCDRKEDYKPDLNNFHFIVDDGLVIYEVQTPHCLEFVTAIDHLPSNTREALFEQWDFLAALGWHTVYSIVEKSNKKARFACRAIGMTLRSNDEINIYSQVIHDELYRKN